VRRAALTGGTTAALFLSFVLSAPAPAAETGDPCDAGKQALNAGQYAESVRLYRDCLATGSLDHEALLDAHYNAGRALSELGRYSEAAEHFARVVEIVPDFTPAMLVLASTLEQAGSYEEALTALDMALEIDADFVEALIQRGNMKLNQDDLQGAIADYTHAIEVEPQNAIAFVNRALANSYRGDFESTLADAETALALAPGDTLALYLRAEQFNLRGRFEEARQDLEIVLAAEPDNAEAHHELATSLFQLGRPEESLAAVDRAVEINPLNGRHHAARGYIHLRLGNDESAMDDFDRALDDQPADYTWYFYRAHALAWLGRQDEARRDIEDAFALMAEDERAWHSNEICWELLLQGRTELAAPLCEQAVAQVGDAPSLDSRAFLNWQLGKTDQAEADLLQAQKVARNAWFFEPKRRLGNFPATLTQGLLTFLGYRPDAADRSHGQATTRAIMAFQRDRGLDVNGEISPELIEALKAARP
jgi:tetratricopeptide (TPR) repeat protein